MSVVAALNPWVRKTFRAARRTVRALAFRSPLLGGGEVMTWLVRRICLVGSFDTVAWIRYSTNPRGTYQLSHSSHGCRHYAEALEFPVGRSEDHQSELQSLMRSAYAVFCLK